MWYAFQLICAVANMSLVQSALEAFSHPGRREMLELVMAEEMPVGVLAQRTGMSQPAASQHLKVLRDSDLVNVRIEGSRRLYSVNFEALARLKRELDAFWGDRLDALREATHQSDAAS